MVLWLREQGVPFTAVFCDTGWEHPLTYAYVEEINRTILGGQLVTVKSAKYAGMVDLVTRKGRVPSIRARFCTEELKVLPMAAYLKTLTDEATAYQGIRAEESPSRAGLPMREWSDLYDCWIERPLFRWSAVQVFAYLDAQGVSANPLYRLGSKRVGCFPCVLTGHTELQRVTAMLPEVWDRIEELETASSRSFFPSGYIPARFCSGWDDKTGKPFPRAADVRRYVIGTPTDQLELLGETPACMSVYNLCE